VTVPVPRDERPPGVSTDRVTGPDAVRADRSHRRRAHRRRVREQLLAVTVILLALAVTVALLLGQWRGSGTGTASGMPAVGSVGWPGDATVPA
jgi:hypothetical protein